MNKVLELLEPKAILYNLEAENSEQVLSRLGELLFNTGYVKETFVNGAIERERNFPTGLELGGEINAAIPHTDIEHVIKPGLALAILKDTVNFKNMGNKEQDVPCKLVFVMALNEAHAQVDMLRELATVLQKPETLKKLIVAVKYSDIVEALS